MSFETLLTPMSSSELNRTNSLKAQLFSKTTSYSFEESDKIILENQEIIDINKENYYQELYSMDIFRYMEHTGYKDLMDIPESDYKYLGVNKQILLQLQEWNNWFENFLENEKEFGSKGFTPKEESHLKQFSFLEPDFPTLLPRVIYIKKHLVPNETRSKHPSSPENNSTPKVAFRV